LAKANAAIEEERMVKTVYETAIKKLFPIALANGKRVNTLIYASKVGFFGIHSIGKVIKAPRLLNEVEIIHRNGNIEMKEIKMITR
jgi:hypothetical protein